jgi:hypothetical protein
MLNNDPAARKLIASALGQAIDQTVKEHLSGISQEPAITSRIGQDLENTINGKAIFGYDLHVITQDIPDRGSNSLEKPTGTDLYVGISVQIESKIITKGFLVQAKISDKLNSQKDFDGLRDDCSKMLKRSESSYVWLYENSGVRVVNAEDVLKNSSRNPSIWRRRRASTVFSRTLECTEGDFRIGLPPVRSKKMTERRKALGEMLEKLRADRGVDISILKQKI